MDQKTVDSLKQRLANRRVVEQPQLVSGDKPLYLQDLERRAALCNTTVDAVYARDQDALRQGPPTADCLRPDEVMIGVADEQKLSKKSWEHLQDCGYCSLTLAASRPDLDRHRDLIASLAQDADTAPPARLPGRADAFFEKLDHGINRAVHWGKQGVVIAACVALLVYFAPQWLRNKAPTWAWTHRQLETEMMRALEKGDTAKADVLASELITREPANPGWYVLRSQARLESGKEEQARHDLEAANHLLDASGRADFRLVYIPRMPAKAMPVPEAKGAPE